ncbi:MAG: VOC family protein [Bdellovibrionota bacterium]
MTPFYKLRVARPSKDLQKTLAFYSNALGLDQISHFEHHDAFSGIMLGKKDWPYHFEFTKHATHAILPTPTQEDLIVFYVPEKEEWEQLTQKIERLGHRPVTSLNPYWDLNGKTYEDPDGYRVVIQNAQWG